MRSGSPSKVNEGLTRSIVVTRDAAPGIALPFARPRGQDYPMFAARPASPDDHAAIGALLTAAFASPAEAHLVEKLRADGAVACETVVDQGGHVVAFALCAWMAEPRGWVALAPVATLPGQQGRGAGALAVRAVLAAADAAGARAAVVLGAPAYYGRFGFSTQDARHMQSPYPLDHTGVLAFGPDLAGPERRATLVYPAAFSG